MGQVVDPAVSRAKFEREVENFDALAGEYRERGWFLIEASFPRVLILLAAPQLQPSPVVTGVSFDFSDYDLRPPSVKLVNPFTGRPFSAEELPTRLPRRTEVEAQLMPGMNLPPGAEVPRMVQDQPLIQVYPEEDPFLCIPGVREYHDHPAHSGDAWELHRNAGAGRLIRLLEVIDTYGLRPLSAYNVQLVTQITGFSQADVPS